MTSIDSLPLAARVTNSRSFDTPPRKTILPHTPPPSPLQERRAISAARSASFSSDNSSPPRISSNAPNGNSVQVPSAPEILRRRLSISTPSHILTGSERMDFRQRFPPTPLPTVLQTPSAFTGMFGPAGDKTGDLKQLRRKRAGTGSSRGSGGDYFSDIETEVAVEDEEVDTEDMGEMAGLGMKKNRLPENAWRRSVHGRQTLVTRETGAANPLITGSGTLSPFDFVIAFLRCSFHFLFACLILRFLQPIILSLFAVLVGILVVDVVTGWDLGASRLAERIKMALWSTPKSQDGGL